MREKKGSNKKSPTSSSSEETEKKRRSSLTDTPVTSSSSSEGVSTDSQPCSSKAMKKKRKPQKRTADEGTSNSQTRNQFKTMLHLGENGAETQPVYTSTNSFTPNTIVWSGSSTNKTEIPVTNVDMDIILNHHPFGTRPLDYAKNDWMKNLQKSLIEGHYNVFLHSVRYMCVVLYRKNPDCRSYTIKGLVKRVIEYDPAHQQTIFMLLCARRTARCVDVDHSFCRLARTLLQNIDPATASRMLAIASKMQGRTALHLAVATGCLCQVRLLLEYDCDVDARDRDNKTPLYFAIKNKNLEMVKLLLWYGADFSQRPEFKEKLILTAASFESHVLFPWMEQRISSLTKKFYQFISELCRGVFAFKPDDAISDLHIMRISYNMDTDTFNPMDSVNWVTRSIELHMKGIFEAKKNEMALLFILPFCYSPQDQGSPGGEPCIYRTSLTVENKLQSSQPWQLFPTKPLLQTPEGNLYELDSAITNPNNGNIFCFKMLDCLGIKTYTLSAHLNVKGLTKQQKRTTLLGIQVYKVLSQDLNSKKLN